MRGYVLEGGCEKLGQDGKDNISIFVSFETFALFERLKKTGMRTRTDAGLGYSMERGKLFAIRAPRTARTSEAFSCFVKTVSFFHKS